MHCHDVEQQLGRYVDDEISPVDRTALQAHLENCASCRAELTELNELVSQIANSPSATVPEGLWENIRRELHETQAHQHQHPRPQHRKGPVRLRAAGWAIAASVVLAVGLGWFSLVSVDSTAQASTLDFGVLLDALPLDAQKAFRKFLVRYDGKPTTPVAAKRIASELNFDTPSELPGGFRLQSVYELRIGGATGIAAAYDRDGEFLAAVFHPPMRHERFGSHENYPCVIGAHCGHKVQVGEWKLVHLTDPTTCHCLLSRLDEQREIPSVMNAIAPEHSQTGTINHHHQSQD